MRRALVPLAVTACLFSAALLPRSARAQVRDDDSGETVHLAPFQASKHVHFVPTTWLPAGFTPEDRARIEKTAARLSTPYYLVFASGPPFQYNENWLRELGDEVVADWRAAKAGYDPARTNALFINWSAGCQLPPSERADEENCEYLINSRLTASDPKDLSDDEVEQREDEREALDQFSLDEASDVDGRLVQPDVAAFEAMLRDILGRVRRETQVRRAADEAREEILVEARSRLDVQASELARLVALHTSAAAPHAADYASLVNEAALKRSTSTPAELDALAERLVASTRNLEADIADEQRRMTRSMILLTVLLTAATGAGFAGARLRRTRIRELNIVHPWEVALSESAIRLAEIDAERARWKDDAALDPHHKEAVDKLSNEADTLALLVHALSDRVSRARALAARSLWLRIVNGTSPDLEVAFEIDPALLQGSRVVKVTETPARILPHDLIRRIREAFADYKESAENADRRAAG